MEFLTKHKRLFIITMSILCVIFIILTQNPSPQTAALRNSVGFVLNPIATGFTNAGNWVSGRVEFFREMNELHDSVNALREENAFLRVENIRLQEAQIENEKLSELLEIRNEYAQYPMVGAQIIARDPTGWHDAYRINKGLRDGITENMVALAPEGVLGIVIESNYADALVISLIDDRFSITAKASRTGDHGFVRGDIDLMGSGLSRMGNIDIDSQILPGDEILTSPRSLFFPPSLLIGRVREVNTDANGLTKHAIIEPAVDLSRLETILIITQDFSVEQG
jgi:rod shape-determining protein MreC